MRHTLRKTLRHNHTARPATTTRSGWRRAGLLGLATLASSYLAVRARTAKAEREHPPAGRFVEVDGIRLHYLEQGEGPVLLLLHGNVVTADDFRLSGLLETLASTHRVIAFDRPGYGYSQRPHATSWSAPEQARLLRHALRQLGADEYLVLAHSWGTLVALAMALQAPAQVRGLLLLSGYYYPSARPDAPLVAMAALPGVGTILRHTLSPLLGRAAWPLAAKGMFSPREVPASFRREDPWMLLRPGQVRAVATEAALMASDAAALARRYGELQMPVLLMAGENDRVVDPRYHTVQLHRAIAHSELTLLPDMGHMVQHLAQEDIANAVDDLAARAGLDLPSAMDGLARRRHGASPPAL